MRTYRESDLETNRLVGEKVAVLGYGNQGHAHALNLRDSGACVLVGNRRGGDGWNRAVTDGFQPQEISQAVEAAHHVAIMLPDEVQGHVFEREIAPYLKTGTTLFFAHGFSVAFDVIRAPEDHDVILVAPKGQGHYVREQFVRNQGLPCLVAVETNSSGHALEKALSYAQMIGCLRAGALETSFREEAVTDLFGEQAVLCGGVPTLVVTAFETLVKNGYSPEVAYIECLHELKIITDLMHRGGIASMKERISRTAAWGSVTAGKELVSEAVAARMESILRAIESGEFATDWQKEAQMGQEHLKSRLDEERNHPIERAGNNVRALMPHLKEVK